MNLGLAAPFAVIDAGNGIRTADLFDVTFDGSGNVGLFDINHSNTGSGNLFDIDVSGVHTGKVISIVYSAAATGDAIEVDMTSAVAAKAFLLTGAGARTDDMFEINDSSTGNAHIWDVNMSGIYTGNVLDITYATDAATGHAISITTGTNLAGNAMLITTAGIRTAPVIRIAGAATDGGTDDHLIFLDQSGLLDSNLIQLTFSTVASTGNGIGVVMDTNVAGMAIDISSAGTGVSGEGSCLNVSHTGNLVAGADGVRLLSTGSPSSTSNVLAVEQTTGAGTAGAYAVYVNATGANVEALKVDAGKVVFDETLEVTGASTLTGAVTATAGCQSTALAVTATSDGLTTGLITSGTRYVTATSASADNIVTLPTAVVGNIITMYIAQLVAKYAHLLLAASQSIMLILMVQMRRLFQLLHYVRSLVLPQLHGYLRQ